MTSLLIRVRIRSEPASGASVTVRVPPRASTSSSSGARLSTRSEETETRAPIRSADVANSASSGWSATAAPSSPTRSERSSARRT